MLAAKQSAFPYILNNLSGKTLGLFIGSRLYERMNQAVIMGIAGITTFKGRRLSGFF